MKKKTQWSRALMAVQAHFPLVTTVEDAKTSILIEVTPRDAAWAAKKNHSRCALARACEHVRGVDAAIISRSMGYLIHGTKAVRYDLSEGAKREVVTFDRGAGFTPGKYLLNAPDKYRRLGPKPGRKRGSNTEGTGHVRHYVMTHGVRAPLQST